MDISVELQAIISRLERIENSVKTPGGSVVYHTNKVRNDLTSLIKNRDYLLYRQIEALIKLKEIIPDFVKLPPLRGWAISPDVALKMYNHVLNVKPKYVVEFGSGASTFIIAQAMKKNNFGKLISIDHMKEFSEECRETICSVNVEQFVDFIVAPLELWEAEHLESEDDTYWYSIDSSLLPESIDFVFIDGPPGIKCRYSRYPALPFTKNHLSDNCQVWLDDSDRPDEKEIIKNWMTNFNFVCEDIKFEKGLAVLKSIRE